MYPQLTVYQGDNLSIMKEMQSASFQLIYLDPPFNTGTTQFRRRFKTENGIRQDAVSFGYEDDFDDYEEFITPRLVAAYELLSARGSLFLHLDYHEVHYAKVFLDRLFGRESFINEIIWSYDYGARSKKRWSTKHDTILWYAKDPKHYTFNYDAIDRIPYLAPSLVGEEKAIRGKTPTDVWWNTIVSPNGKEKTGYATQKPRNIIDRITLVHSNEGDLVGDFFAGSGTFGESAYLHNRNCILVDKNCDAIAVMKNRFADFHVNWR